MKKPITTIICQENLPVLHNDITITPNRIKHIVINPILGNSINLTCGEMVLFNKILYISRTLSPMINAVIPNMDNSMIVLLA